MNYRQLLRVFGSCAILGLLMVPTSRVHAADTVVLRAHFTVGQTWTEVSDQRSVQKLALVIGKGAAAQKQSDNSTEDDHFVVTMTVMKVGADGSADVKISFGPSYVTKDGKKVAASMAGVTRLMHVDSFFNKRSSTTTGTKGLPDQVLSSLPSTEPTAYPGKPIAIGGTWTRSESQAGLGTLIEKLTLVSLGTMNGRQVAVVHGVISQVGLMTNSGLTFNGHMTGTADSTWYVDTQQDAVPQTANLTWKGSIKGTVSGLPVTGTFSFAFVETDSSQ